MMPSRMFTRRDVYAEHAAFLGTPIVTSCLFLLDVCCSRLSDFCMLALFDEHHRHFQKKKKKSQKTSVKHVTWYAYDFFPLWNMILPFLRHSDRKIGSEPPFWIILDQAACSNWRHSLAVTVFKLISSSCRGTVCIKVAAFRLLRRWRFSRRSKDELSSHSILRQYIAIQFQKPLS